MGGALTETFFCVKGADKDIAIDRDIGAELPFVSINDMLSYAETTGKALDMVIPTRIYLTEDTDENGDRYADIEEHPLSDFVSSMANGTYEGSPEIAFFEIGNEYWGAAGG